MSKQEFISRLKFHHFFQPIYNLKSRTILGYEALFRSDQFTNPECVFLEARKQKKLYDLDSRSILKAILTYLEAGLKNNSNLFLNLFPSTILNPKLPLFLKKIISENKLNSQQFIIEILEAEKIDDLDLFKFQLKEIKKLGFKIAMDDIGSGYSKFISIIEFEPDYLKLDRYFAHDLHTSKQKQNIITLFLNFCKQNNCQLILEGLENEHEFAFAKALGVSIAQGYFLGKPAPLEKHSKII